MPGRPVPHQRGEQLLKAGGGMKPQPGRHRENPTAAHYVKVYGHVYKALRAAAPGDIDRPARDIQAVPGPHQQRFAAAHAVLRRPAENVDNAVMLPRKGIFIADPAGGRNKMIGQYYAAKDKIIHMFSLP